MFVGTLAWQKQAFRYQALTELNLSEIHLKNADLFKNSATYQWKDQHHEVLMNGLMYEVLGIKKTTDGYSVYLAKDLKESNWFNIFEDLDLAQKKHMQNLLNLFNLIGFYLPSVNLHLTAPNFFSLAYLQTQVKSILESHLFELIKPPCF
ncbi:MAG: hypothetical protein WCR21_13410 [Bacteroidota bacterium]